MLVLHGEPRGKGGFTLVEVAIGLVLGGIVTLAVLTAAKATSSAFRSGATLAELEASTRRALDEITARLEDASMPLVGPVVAAPLYTTFLDYQRIVGYTGATADLGPPERIELQPSPADPDDGVDNDGNGLVDERRIVWFENPGGPDERTRVLSRWIAATAEGEVAGNFADDNGNGVEDEEGLSFDFQDELLTVRVTLQRRDPDGVLLTRSLARTIRFRNDR